MLRGGAWLTCSMFDADGEEPQMVWVCNQCRAVVREKRYVCPQCSQGMIAVVGQDGVVIMMENTAIQLAENEIRIE